MDASLNSVNTDLDPLAVAVGSRIRELRLRAGQTQKEAAAEVMGNVQWQGHWSRWERGLLRPNLATIETIARYFGAPMESFGVAPGELSLSDADIEEANRLLEQAQAYAEQARECTERAREILGRRRRNGV